MKMDCKDKDIVRFTATPQTGFEFVGWYKEDGTAAPNSTVDGVTYTYTDEVYVVKMTADVSLVAKFGVKIKIEADCTEGASGTVQFSGGIYKDSDEKVFAVGDYVTLNSLKGSLSSFCGGWYEKSDTEYRRILEGATDSQAYGFYAIAPKELVYRFVTEDDLVYVALRTSDVGTYTAFPRNPNYYAGYEDSIISEVTEEVFKRATRLSSVPADARKFYKMPGFGALTLCVVPSTLPANGVTWSMADIEDGAIGDYEEQETTQFVDEFYCANNCVLYANFNKSGKRTHTRYLGGMKVSMWGPDGENREETSEKVSEDYSVSGTSEYGNRVISHAIDVNGKVFEGWYLDADYKRPAPTIAIPGGTVNYKDAWYDVSCISDLTLYCKADDDANAIFVWEGSTTNKRMRWTSKTYVASRPFDVVSARVDADGYSTGEGLVVKATMFSSPDSSQEDEDVRSLDVDDQDSLRFARGRPERYLQVTVESEDAVNAVFVGTNSKELAV